MSKTLKEQREVLSDLLKKHRLETYIDYATMCENMKDAVDAMRLSTDMGIRDEVEIQNLYTLSQLLEICKELFVNCDDYYRTYPKQ